MRLDISAYTTLSGGAALNADGELDSAWCPPDCRVVQYLLSLAARSIRIAGKLSEQGYVSRGFLGVALQPVALPLPVKEALGQDAGTMLLAIEPEGPAAVGGLILGDVLVAGDAHPLAQPEALAELLELGQVVKFKVLRASILRDLDVRVGSSQAADVSTLFENLET